MKILLRKLKAWWTGNYPCSFESEHGHNLDYPSIHSGNQWAWFRCSECNGILTYNGLIGCFDEFKERKLDERWDCELTPKQLTNKD